MTGAQCVRAGVGSRGSDEGRSGRLVWPSHPYLKGSSGSSEIATYFISPPASLARGEEVEPRPSGCDEPPLQVGGTWGHEHS